MGGAFANRKPMTRAPAPFRLEWLGESEFARLREIRLRSLLDSPDAFGSTYAESAQRSEERWRQQLALLATVIAVDRSQRDVGIARGAPYDGRPGSAILLSMWVAQEARGQGVGEMLVLAVIGWAKDAGFDALFLDVADDNAKAIALYERCGFAPTGAKATLPAPRQHILEHERCLRLR